YAKAHDGFDSTIEYALTGQGHTIDAKVETRSLPASAKGPHLLQSFTMEQGENRPDEWWTFTCKDFRCDYQMYAGQPPADFKKLWDKGRKLSEHMRHNNAFQPTHQRCFASLVFPHSLRSLGAAERGRWGSYGERR